MRRAIILHKRVVRVLAAGGPYAAGVAVDVVAKLPVIAKDAAKKSALLKELRSIERLSAAVHRRTRAAAAKLDRLTVEKKLLAGFPNR